MRLSQLLLPTVKEDPAGAEAISHKLMVRAGLVRQLGAGIYVFLPAGWRVMTKIEALVRAEMEAIGCQEILMPVINPAEIWQESGRWQTIDQSLFRFKDRKGADMALAMTHEEVITWLAAREIKSYKQLPQLWYHIQTKERDEARPRSGLLRTREFIMKDSYSLDTSVAGLQVNYEKHIAAYNRFYDRCGLDYIMVQGDSGMMGGDISHEYMAFSEAGEDDIVYCRGCGYGANVETASAGADRQPPFSETPATQGGSLGGEGAPGVSGSVDVRVAAEIHTPNAHTIAEVAAFLGLPARAFIKALVVMGETSGAAMVLLRGDHDLAELKLAKLLGGGFRLATADEVVAAQGVQPGFVGPMPTTLPLYADEVLRRGDYVAGANRAEYHRSGVNLSQIADVTFADLRVVGAGDPCPHCGQPLAGATAIEIGNIFQLGTKYSAAMGARFLDEEGNERDIVMGSYGIGIARVAAAVVEQHHDDHGIIWPASIAPWQVHLVQVRASDEVQTSLAERLYQELQAAGIDVLYDDRDLSPGIKFKDADLLGCPAQVVVGKRAGEGFVELKRRAGGERRDVAVADLVTAVRDLLVDA